MRTFVKPVLAFAAVAAACFSATDAFAFGHHRWGSSGGSSGGSWGSSGGSYGSWGSSGGSWGSSGGSSGGYYTVRKFRGHSSGGSWGSSGGAVVWGSSGGGSSGGYYNGSSGGNWGGSSGGYSAPAYSTPTEGTPASPEEPKPSDADAEGKSAYTGAGMLLVKVPANARIFVNGKATTSTGNERQYISRGLVRGANYKFEVKAEFTRDGEPVSITKTAQLTAGSNAELTFDELADETDSLVTVAKPVTTTLTVRVPDDAKVFLAGNETKQTGEVREFTTTKLTPGDGWTNYTVRAEVEQDGKMVTKEQLVSIKAGETKEISFDFADNADDSPVAETAQK